MENRAHSSKTPARGSKGSGEVVQFLQQAHRTEFRKVTERVLLMEVQKTHPNLVVKVRREKRQKPLHKIQARKLSHGGKSCKYWHVSEGAKFSKLQRDAGTETSVFNKHAAKSADDRKIRQLLQSKSMRMQLRKIQSDTKTQFRVRRHHLANKHVPKREIWGPTLGFIQTGSQNQRTPNAPTFGERSIE